MDDSFKIIFVENGENDSIMVEASELLRKEEQNLDLEWTSSEDCLSVAIKGKPSHNFFIFNKFEGLAFQHIQSLGCRIYGPLCLISNLKYNMDLPKDTKRPIFSLAMKGIKVCCTSVEKKSRDEIKKLVHLMSGEMAGDLTADSTHLIAGEVGSVKYMVAQETNKSIMSKEWVYKVWESAQIKHILASDEIFHKYKCPNFLGLTVCVSGFNQAERNQMKTFVLKGGGKYSGELKMNECTHLIVKEPKGAKYEAAKNWKIKIVTDRWLFDCVDKGKYLDPRTYLFEKAVKTSTPERLSTIGPNIIDVSAISVDGRESTFQEVNETDMLSGSTRISLQLDTTGRMVGDTRMDLTCIETDKTVTPADVFLDGCRVYFSGLELSMQEKLKKIVTAGGGFRAMDLEPGVTHIIVGKQIISEISVANNLTDRPFMVRSDWLMDCYHKNSHLDEKNYLVTIFDPEQEQTSLSTDKCEKEPIETSEAKDGVSSLKVDEAASDLQMAELLSQYIPEDVERTAEHNTMVERGMDVEERMKENPREKSLPEDEMTQDPNDVERPAEHHTIEEKGMESENRKKEDNTTDKTSLKENMNMDPNDMTDMTVDQNGIFNNKVFIFLGLIEEARDELIEQVESKGGRVVNLNQTRQIADIAIVPLTGYQVNMTVPEVLTVIWLQMCLETDAWVPVDHWLAKPIEIPEHKPLTDCHISVSGFSGAERQSIVHVLESLGAVCQNHFARRTTKQVKVSTHLIANEPQGSKYTAAKQWGIPAIGKEWLIACLTSGNRPPEEDFDIEFIHEKLEEKMLNIKGNRPSDEDFDIENIHEKPEEKMLNDKGNRPLDEDFDIENIHEKPEEKMLNDKGNRCSEEEFDFENIHEKLGAKMLKDKSIQGANTSSSTPLGLIKGGGETPGTFMQPGYRLKFNLPGVFDADTPDTAGDLNKSTPMGKVFSRQIEKVVCNLANMEKGSTPCQSQPEPPLYGIIIAVARKLGRNQVEYNNLVVELGGDYTWQYNDIATHFVFQGRPNDTNKEFRKAREDGKFIVSPHWLYMCQEQSCRVDESLFPHHYNPSQALTLITDKDTPLRSRRAAARNKGSKGETPLQGGNGKTPGRKLPVLNIQDSTPLKNVENSLKAVDENINKDCDITVKNAGSKTTGKPDNDAKTSDHSAETMNRLEEMSINTPDVSSREKPAGISDPPSNSSKSEERSKDQEMKDALCKTLETVLAEASSRSRKSIKKKGKRINLGGQRNSSSGNTPESTLTRSSATGWSSKDLAKESNSVPEPSQSVQVMWDDPTERLEKEKLAHRLERVCDPSQNTDDCLAAMDFHEPNGMNARDTNNHQFNSIEARGSKETYRSPTPEAPSIAFPIARPSTSVMSPQPVELISEESSDSRMSCAGNPMNKVPCFMISGVEGYQERAEYGALIEQLGGRMSDKQHFDPSCTHLVVAQPIRNEKYLSSVAAGNWVLHKSYFEACRKEGKLVKEENHEWGSDFTLSLMQNMTAQAFSLATAAHRWRKKVSSMRKSNPACQGAFHGWNIMLCLDSDKEQNFQRLLEAGGANVQILRPPFSKNLKVSHAFLDLNKVTIPQEDLETLISLNIQCLKASYMAAYLTKDPPPDPTEFYAPEIVALKVCMPDDSRNRKRKALFDDGDSCTNQVEKVSRS